MPARESRGCGQHPQRPRLALAKRPHLNNLAPVSRGKDALDPLDCSNFYLPVVAADVTPDVEPFILPGGFPALPASCKSGWCRIRSQCMSSAVAAGNCDWLCTGQEVFPAMLSAIDAATRSVCLEAYIYASGSLGVRFREALVRARQRQVRVQVL